MGWGCWANYISIQLNPIILLGAQSKYLLKNGHVHLAPRARDLPMVSHVRAKNNCFSFLLSGYFSKRKMVAYFSGEIMEEWEGRTCW
jgi:hypothetical protein